MKSKDMIQIGLLAVIAGALIYLAVSRSGSDDASSTAGTAAVTNSPSTPPNTLDKQSFDPTANQQAAIDNSPKTTIAFNTYDHDFGNIKQDSENRHVFRFTNTGKEPLLIESATGSCGCTVPQYPKEPIPPGGTGEIMVEYKPGKQENQQNKTVTVTANTEPKQTTLRIKANVLKEG